MQNYLSTLEGLSQETGVGMLKAFKQADIPSSTYYRTILGRTELRFETAKKVHDAIQYLHSLQEMRDHSEKLRRDGKPVKNRTIRAKFKSRRTGT